MKGVDISHYQKGLSIQQIQDAGHDFAIIKLTEGSWFIDAAAFDFYREAYALGFPVGCYCYSHATTPEDARNEAQFLIKTVNGFPMPCGIFLDVEEPKQLGLSSTKLRAVLDAWCEAISAAGYIPGVYGSENALWAKLDPDAMPEDCLLWVAHFGKQPDVVCDIWQSSDSGSIPGYDGSVDTDETRSERFRALVLRGFTQGSDADEKTGGAEEVSPPMHAPDLAVMLLQTLMAFDGYWDTGEIHGVKTQEFRQRIVEYAEDVAGC